MFLNCGEVMIWAVIIIFIWVLYVVFEKKIKRHSRVQELPEFTLNIVGKIFSDDGDSYEHEVIVVLYQNELKTVVGIESEKFIKVKKIAIIAKEDENTVGVYIDAMRVGYLNGDSADEFSNFIKTRNFSEHDAFEVDTVVMGNPKGDKWFVKLDMPPNMHKFRYKIYK